MTVIVLRSLPFSQYPRSYTGLDIRCILLKIISFNIIIMRKYIFNGKNVIKSEFIEINLDLLVKIFERL